VFNATDFFQSRDKKQNACLLGTTLHSRYDIEKECKRFLTSNNVEQSSTILIVGDCFHHIANTCNKMFPDILCYSIVPDAVFTKFVSSRKNTIMVDTSKYTGKKVQNMVHSCLLSKIDDSSIGKLLVLEWLPSKQIFPAVHAAIHDGITHFLQQLKTNISTTAYFGSMWIRNTIKNILSLRTIVKPKNSLPYVCICAPGPSLKKTMQSLPANIPVLACAAATSCLPQKPHIFATIHTDAGYWAKRHVKNTYGAFAHPMQAACVHEKETLAIHQNSFVDSLFLLESYAARIPEHGSVLGSAIYYASTLTDGPIYLLGADLSFLKNRLHEKNYVLDCIRSQSSRRLSYPDAVDYAYNAHHSYDSHGKRVTQALRLFADSLSLFPKTIMQRLFFVDSLPPAKVNTISAKECKKRISTRYHVHYSKTNQSMHTNRQRVVKGIQTMLTIAENSGDKRFTMLQLHLIPHMINYSEGKRKHSMIKKIQTLQQRYL